jgi:hypothetical protein
MARTLTPVDAYAIVQEMVDQMTGKVNAIRVVDASSFASAGELIMSYGTENVTNTLGLVIGRSYMAVRPYDAKLRLINSIDSGTFTNRMRKISFYARDTKPSGWYNTDLNTNLAMGFTNGQNKDSNGNARSTKSQWEQNVPVPLEMNFAGTDTWQDSQTVYENQLEVAFRSPEEFARFVEGYMMEKANDIESQKEGYNRLALIQHIGAVYDMSANMRGSVVNLTSAFNTEFGTSYTSAQLRSTYLKEFLAFMVQKIQIDSDRMTNRSAKNHWSPAKTVDGESYTLLRHTPKSRQKLMLYNPLIIKSRAYVFPELFNEQYLKIENFEPVDYWQNEAEPEKVDVIPAIPNVSTPNAGQIAGAEVEIPYLVGMLFDEDALMVDYQLDTARSTPVEARKGYRNIWYTFAKNIISDTTENSIIYIMAD